MANYNLAINTTPDQEDALTELAAPTKDTNPNVLNGQVAAMLNTLVAQRKSLLLTGLAQNSLVSLEGEVAQGPQAQQN